MHLFLLLLSLSILLLHVFDHKVKSLPVPHILVSLLSPSLLVGHDLLAQLIPDYLSAFLRLAPAQHPPVSVVGRAVKVSGAERSVLVIIDDSRVSYRDGQTSCERTLHAVVQALSQLPSLPIVLYLFVELRLVGKLGLAFKLGSQLILLLDRLHHVCEMLPLLKLRRTHPL
jgi:hypothetical protein